MLQRYYKSHVDNVQLAPLVPALFPDVSLPDSEHESDEDLQ